MTTMNKTGKARKPRTTAPAFDYSTVKATEAKEITRGGAPSVLGTPFPAWLKESRETGKPKEITIPKANATQALTYIRNAAGLAGHGVRTSVVEKGANAVITFQAKDKRAYNGRKSGK